MLVMLPAGVLGALGSVAIRAEAGWVQALARPLEPVAQPLLVVSTLLLAVGALSCGRAAVLTALGGGALLYLGMYVVTGPAGQTQPALFYSGLALFVASPLLPLVRRRLRACRPMVTKRTAHRVLLASLGASALLLALAPAVGWGRATATLHARHGAGRDQAQREDAATSRPIVTVANDAFVWSGRVLRHTEEDAWFPRISTDGALLEVREKAEGGQVFVQVMDGRAAVVYERAFDAIPDKGIRAAVTGSRGVWMVTLRFEGFSGTLKVELAPLPPREDP